MPLPPDVETLAGALSATYRAAWADITEELARVHQGLADNPRLWRRRDRLEELQRTVERLMADVDETARAWLTGDLPRVYRFGAEATARQLGATATFTAVDQQALVLLAQETGDDLLAATRHVRRTTKTLIRRVVTAQLPVGELAGRTARQTAKAVADQLIGDGIWAVTYKNGAKVGLGDYADVVVRTKSAVAANFGTLNQGTRLGVAFYEITDGAGCGWASHSDPDLANGKIVSADELAAYPISHPRCARGAGPRPDLTSARGARDAEPFSGGQPQRTSSARTAASSRRREMGLQARDRTPQAVLDRRARMLQDRAARLAARRRG